MYLLDTNTFIEAKNRYYGFDIVPSFWVKLESFESMNVAVIANVRDEILDGKDELAQWFESKSQEWIIPTDENSDIVAKFAEVAQYVSTNSQYTVQREKDRFLSKADPWLIAAASVLGATIVTHELSVDKQSKKVKIPDVAKAFNVSCVNIFEMLRALHVTF